MGSPVKTASVESTDDANSGAALCDAGAKAGAAGDTSGAAGEEDGSVEGDKGKALTEKKAKKGEDGKAPADIFPYYLFMIMKWGPRTRTCKLNFYSIRVPRFIYLRPQLLNSIPLMNSKNSEFYYLNLISSNTCIHYLTP